MAESQYNVYNAPENAFFKDLLEHDEFLNRLEHHLKGEVLKTIRSKDKDNNEVITQEWVQVYPSKMNDYGINSVMSYLRAICEKIMSITDFGEEFIDKLANENLKDFTSRLCENWYDYGFSSISDLNEVDNIGQNIIIAQLRRSLDGQTLTAVTSKTTINESRVMNPLEQPQQQLDRRLPLFSKLGLRV